VSGAVSGTATRTITDSFFLTHDSITKGNFLCTCFESRNRVVCGLNVCGLQVRFQAQKEQTTEDDTAINGLKMACCDRNQTVEEVLVETGQFGDWENMHICPEDYRLVCGVRIRYQTDKTADTASLENETLDNTALNGLFMNCCNERGDFRDVIVHEGFEGQWQETKQCPFGSKTCGFNVRSDFNNTDQTAANGLQMACCNL